MKRTLVAAAAGLALVASTVAGQPERPPQPPKLETPGWVQSALNIIKDNADATVLASKQRSEELPTVLCGEAQNAISVEIFGSACNVTRFDVTNVLGTRSPLGSCEKFVFGKDTCTKYPGTLNIAIAPASTKQGFTDSKNPDVAGYLKALGLANLEEVGSFSADVLFPDHIVADAADFLPRLKKVSGIPEAKSNDPSLQSFFSSQFKLNGGFGGQSQLSFSKIGFSKLQSVEGTFQVTSTEAEDLNNFAAVQTVSRDYVVTNNAALTTLWTSGVISLKSVGGGMYVAYNNALTSFGTPATALGSIGLTGHSNGLKPNGLQVMGNPALESLAGLNYLTKVGGALMVINNTALASLSGLDNLAAVNVTGIPALKLPEAFKGLDAFQLKPPAVLITSNPKLADISALGLLAGCASQPPQASGIIVEVSPADSGLKCTLTSYSQICEYIKNQNTVPENSSWRQTGVCLHA